MRGHAPGWQVRCRKCGLTFDAADLGYVFEWKKVIGGEWRLRWCQQCRRLRWMSVERRPEGLEEPAGCRCDLATHDRSARMQ